MLKNYIFQTIFKLTRKEHNMRKVLITGFDPFGNETINPSYEAVKRLKDRIDDAEIIKAMLPTVFYESQKQLRALMREHQPDIVICVGQAGGRQGISIERVAINLDDARIPDNIGQAPIDETINPKGKNAYFSNLPIKHMLHALNQASIDANISNSAGTFVCNHVLYTLLDVIEQKDLDVKGGFIHVPYIPSQTKTQASMPLDEIVKALEIIVVTALQQEEDLKISGGSIC